MTTAEMARLLREVAIVGAKANFRKDGCVRPVVIAASADGRIRVIGAAIPAEQLDSYLRELVREDRLVALALIAEAWTAPVRNKADLNIRARERSDREEKVIVEVHTENRSASWAATIHRKPDRLGPFAEAGATVAGLFSNLWRAPGN